jgi:protein ImuB
MQAWVPWQPQPAKKAAAIALPGHAALLPTWLLAEPLLLSAKPDGPHYHGPLTILAGPQRLETGWLEGQAVLRDYFVARSAQAGLLWIYRERLAAEGQKKTSTDTSLRWFLHGLFA